MAHILNIPLEVLLQITSYLTTPEYGYLRRSCKQLEALLLGAFAKEFFSKRQFALIEFSIKTLVDISKSRFGPSLTHVIIHLEHPFAGVTSITPGPAEFPALFTIERAVLDNKFYAECISHDDFITTGLDVEMLSDALRHLPNLETIGMRDFDSKNRRRDNSVWNSYGCPTLEEETKRQLTLPGRGRPAGRGSEYTSHVLRTILRAVGNGAVSDSNPKLTRLEVLLHHCQLPDSSFRIPDRFEASISLALSKFQAVFLDNICYDIFRFNAARLDDDTRPGYTGGYYLSRFLARAPALEHLRINFQGFEPEATQSLLLWLAGVKGNASDEKPDLPTSLASANASGSLPSLFPPTPELPKLRYFEIGMATVTENVLLTFYEKYKSTLRGISLHKVTLTSPQKSNVNLCARFCAKMARFNLDLETFTLSYMRQHIRGGFQRIGELHFKSTPDPRIKVWRGSAFSQAIKDITDDMHPTWGDETSDDETMEDANEDSNADSVDEDDEDEDEDEDED